MSDQFELASLEGLMGAVKKYGNSPNITYEDAFPSINGIYCPQCGEVRRMKIECLYAPDTFIIKPLTLAKEDIEMARLLVPSIFYYQCVQCEMIFTALLYEGPEGPALAVLPSQRGGLVTPHTPDGVAFYLDQADRAKAVGANSAAVAMFRGALDQLLFDQNYKKGTLREKIKTLGDDISAAKAPKWASDLDDEFLTVIRELGNASIHPNDGDITAQAAFDSALVSDVIVTFSALLHIIYEAPLKTSSLLADLKKASMLKKQRP